MLRSISAHQEIEVREKRKSEMEEQEGENKLVFLYAYTYAGAQPRILDPIKKCTLGPRSCHILSYFLRAAVSQGP